MLYIASNTLSSEICSQLNQLSENTDYEPFFAECVNYPYNSFHYLCKDDTIISFIGLMPVTHSNAPAVEITGLTAKKYQHKGYFKTLLKHALKELSITNISHILSDRRLNYPFIQNTFSHSELLLQLKYTACLDTISNTSFEPDDSIEILEYIYEYDTYEEWIYVITINNIAAGILKFTVNDAACLHHVFIRKSFRNKGYGKRLLVGALKMFANENHCHIILHVTSSNTAAVKLYQNAGFKIIQSLDYFTLHFLEEQ